MLKKMFIMLMVMFFVSVGAVFADNGNGNGCDDCCYGCYSYGDFQVDVKAFGGALDADIKFIPNGMAFGIGGAGGAAQANANGYVYDGTVSGDVEAIGGGLTDTDAYIFNPGIGDVSIGVGSFTENYSIAGASVDVDVVADLYDWYWYGNGYAGGGFCGFVGQFSLNSSMLSESPIFFNSDGYTFGLAKQGSVGSFDGYAADYPGYYGWYYYYPDYSNAKSEAEIEMVGYSLSESYRFVDWNDGVRTEGMGTLVQAGTIVNTYGYNFNDWNGYSYVNGGFVAGGNAITSTKQFNDNGMAKANAAGHYFGSGSLNCNYEGSIAGYSATTLTTVDGMNGTISKSNAGMTVKSQSGYGSAN